MKHARMLYKLGVQIKTDLGTFDTIVVDQCDEKKFNAALNDGYYMTQAEAKAKKHDKPADPKPDPKKESESIPEEKPESEPESESLSDKGSGVPQKGLSKAEKGLQKAKDKLK